jgi:hypothetical protein
MAGRTADDQSRQLTIGHLLEQVDQEFGEPVELERGEGAVDEVAEQQALAGRCRPVGIRNGQESSMPQAMTQVSVFHLCQQLLAHLKRVPRIELFKNLAILGGLLLVADQDSRG